jgi:hypothetical protein
MITPHNINTPHPNPLPQGERGLSLCSQLCASIEKIVASSTRVLPLPPIFKKNWERVGVRGLCVVLCFVLLTGCTTLNIIDEVTTPLPNTTPHQVDRSQKIEVPQDYQQQQMILRNHEKETRGW